MKLIRSSCVTLLALLSYSTASYSVVVLNINNGVLFGASNIEANGVTYNVDFLDGTCSALFNGCDENSDFLFSNSVNDGTQLGNAMQALLDQVFLDTSQGAFDSQPALTNGCVVDGGCNVATPLFRSGGGIGVISAFNSDQILNTQLQSVDHLIAGSLIGDFDSRPLPFSPDTDQTVYAVWTQTSAVPIPAAVWLFGSGLIGLVGLRKNY